MTSENAIVTMRNCDVCSVLRLVICGRVHALPIDHHQMVATQPSLSTSSPDKEASHFPCPHLHLPLQNFERNSRSIQDQLAVAVGCLLGLHSLQLSEGVVLVVLVKCCC